MNLINISSIKFMMQPSVFYSAQLNAGTQQQNQQQELPLLTSLNKNEYVSYHIVRIVGDEIISSTIDEHFMLIIKPKRTTRALVFSNLSKSELIQKGYWKGEENVDVDILIT